jgi:excisionase family DNA binding protein
MRSTSQSMARGLRVMSPKSDRSVDRASLPAGVNDGYEECSSSVGSAQASTEAPRTMFYSVAQVAELLGMSSVTLYRAINSGQFPAIRVRGRVVVPAKAVDAMADAATSSHSLIDPRGWVGR